jgi:hypothetical protein
MYKNGTRMGSEWNIHRSYLLFSLDLREIGGRDLNDKVAISENKNSRGIAGETCTRREKNISIYS